MNAGAYGNNISDVLISVTILDDNLNIRSLSNSELNFGYRNSVFKNGTFVLNNKKSDLILNEINDIMESRRSKQPLEFPSAGSVFRNPEGYSAGRLVQKANLQGEHVGDAYVSLKHANFIINKGHASAEDIIKLIDIVRDRVKEEYGIDLVLEQEIIR